MLALPLYVGEAESPGDYTRQKPTSLRMSLPGYQYHLPAIFGETYIEA
jgi:hypothetical protein